jgi:hypothetical protein
LEKKETARKEAEEARISDLADDFADIIPAYTFSPAEIQGFLLKHKRNAGAALASADQWVKDTLAQKSKKLEKERKEKEEKEAKEAAEKVAKDAESDKVEETESPKANGVHNGTMVNGIDKSTMINGVDKEHLTNGVGTEKMVNGIKKDTETLTNGIEGA